MGRSNAEVTSLGNVDSRIKRCEELYSEMTASDLFRSFTLTEFIFFGVGMLVVGVLLWMTGLSLCLRKERRLEATQRKIGAEREERKAREANSGSSGGFVKQDLARSQLV